MDQPPTLAKFKSKIKILSTRNLHCRKFAAACHAIFINPRHRYKHGTRVTKTISLFFDILLPEISLKSIQKYLNNLANRQAQKKRKLLSYGRGNNKKHNRNYSFKTDIKLESSQSPHTSAKAMLFARWFCSSFPYAPLKAMVTKISKRSRIQDSFRITPKIESLVVCAIPDIPSKFQKDPSITF